jgi:hypothetical protein
MLFIKSRKNIYIIISSSILTAFTIENIHPCRNQKALELIILNFFDPYGLFE